MPCKWNNLLTRRQSCIREAVAGERLKCQETSPPWQHHSTSLIQQRKPLIFQLEISRPLWLTFGGSNGVVSARTFDILRIFPIPALTGRIPENAGGPTHACKYMYVSCHKAPRAKR